jgi:chemotaxis signal transduction protein
MIFGINGGQTEETKIIIIEHRDQAVGLMVDRILTVKNYGTGDFEDMRSSLISEEKKYIAGIIKDKGDIITLVKAEYFFAGKEK